MIISLRNTGDLRCRHCRLLKSSLLEYLHHHLALWKGGDGLVEIVVGTLVFRNQLAVDGEHGTGVDAEELLHRETDRRGKFYNAEMASLLQHSAHLGETLVEVLEVAYAKGGNDGIEGLVFIAQVQTVLLLETDHLVQSHALHLLPSYLS